MKSACSRCSLRSVLLTILSSNAGVGPLVNGASLVVVLILPVLMGYAARAARQIARSFRLALRARSASHAEVRRGLLYFRGLRRRLLYAGALGTPSGLVALFSSLRGVGAGPISSGLATALVAALYAVLLVALVAYPCEAAIHRQLLQPEA